MKKLFKDITIILVVFLIVSLLFSAFIEKKSSSSKVALGQLIQQIKQDQVEKIAVKNNDLLITLKNKKNEKSVKENGVSFVKILKDYGIDPAKVKIEITNTGGSELLTTIFIQVVLPLLLILFFFWLLSRQARQSASQTFNFTQSLAKSILPKSKSESKKKKATLKDVAGLKEAKEELQEVIDFLRFPEKYYKMGARIPRGVLLIGPPGCGKTLLARAVAGESNVPFFHISGSEFVELFVGVGASRVRNTFNLAKKHSPSILFIDEIDAIGRQRGAGIGGGNDEREQTLNQILVEMDGFTQETKTIVLAATNRPDVLDPALLRPGRFDRRIVIDLPDINEREAILKIHSQQKPLAKDVNLRVVAERTPGFSGADLANLMNESAILATQKNKKEIGMNELLPSIEKVLLGPERKSRLLSQEEKKIAAYHEAGHALVTASLPHTDPVRKISIISRGQAAGYTLKLPTHDKYLKSRAELIEELSVLLGGYTAERLVFNEITTGASNDLEKTRTIAKEIVTQFGMSEKFGPIAFDESNNSIFLGREIGKSKDYSEKTAEEIDQEIFKIIRQAYRRAQDILTNRRKILEKIANRLLEKETIEMEEFKELVGEKTNK